MKSISRLACAGVLTAGLWASSAMAQSVSFKDPVGDDFGPGTYKYPTDQVYKPGSFDLTDFSAKVNGDKLDLEVGLNSTLEDPWKMGSGFSTQMIFVFIDKDGKEGSGHTKGLAGLNVDFAPKDAWDKAIIISPQAFSRVKSEVGQKGGDAKADIVIPTRVRASGKKITASIPLKDLGGGDPKTWGWQVLVQSNEGFPASTDLLTRKVNEFEGQHRFGGGSDYDCDPHVIDLLAGDGKGDPSEIDAQKQMLSYECGADGSAKKRATLTMVHAK